MGSERTRLIGINSSSFAIEIYKILCCRISLLAQTVIRKAIWQSKFVERARLADSFLHTQSEKLILATREIDCCSFLISLQVEHRVVQVCIYIYI